MRIKKLQVVYEPGSRNLAIVRENAVNYNGCFCSPDLVASTMRDVFHAHQLADEHAWAIGLDVHLHCRGIFEVAHGGGDHALRNVREIMRDMLLVDAVSFIVVHNHPSGNVKPSADDQELTAEIAKASKILNLSFLDHVIIAGNHNYSFRRDEKL